MAEEEEVKEEKKKSSIVPIILASIVCLGGGLGGGYVLFGQGAVDAEAGDDVPEDGEVSASSSVTSDEEVDAVPKIAESLGNQVL